MLQMARDLRFKDRPDYAELLRLAQAALDESDLDAEEPDPVLVRGKTMHMSRKEQQRCHRNRRT